MPPKQIAKKRETTDAQRLAALENIKKANAARKLKFEQRKTEQGLDYKKVDNEPKKNDRALIKKKESETLIEELKSEDLPDQGQPIENVDEEEPNEDNEDNNDYNPEEDDELIFMGPSGQFESKFIKQKNKNKKRKEEIKELRDKARMYEEQTKKFEDELKELREKYQPKVEEPKKRNVIKVGNQETDNLVRQILRF